MRAAKPPETYRRRYRRFGVTALTCWIMGLASAVTAGELRTFTDTSGRTMIAEILDATETTVRVRRDDDRVFELKLDTLSAVDRASVATWRTKRALTFGGIEVRAHRVRLDSERTPTRSSVRKTENWCYRISITNHSRADLADLAFEYRIFYIDDSGTADRDDLPLQRKAGRQSIDMLPAGATAELQSTVVTLQHVEPKPGRRRSDRAKRRIEDELAGIWVRVVQQGELLREFASPSTLIKSESW